jgi:glutaconate CoA-transferase, subunit B
VTSTPSEDAGFVGLVAREIRDNQVCFVGIGVPSLAAMAAKRFHAPKAILVYESGAVDARPPVPPLSTGSPSVMADTAMATTCLGVFAMLQRGVFDLGLLSAAQVDRFGNLNSTVLGPYENPKVRLVGSGGAHDIAALAGNVIIMMPHDPRRFVERVDFVTSPGLLPGNGRKPGRARRGGGPGMLLTPRARFSFEAGELTLDALAPGFSQEQALEGFSWRVPVSGSLHMLEPIEPGLKRVADELVGSWGRGTG